ncbi:MAG: DUF5660 domain-containing protein [Patescibacteria group bacterium]|nr:DUF5660 domain-containing protein [Patescibacteria group bacterium]
MAHKKFKPQIMDKNPIEAVRDIAVSAMEPVVSSVKNDFLKGAAGDILDQTLGWDRLLGTDIAQRSKKQSGEMAPGQEINLKGLKSENMPKNEERRSRIEAGWDYSGEILHAEKRISQAQNRELDVKIQEIVIELKKLAQSSKQLEVTFRNVAVEQRPVNPGKYHLNFFEWMLVTIRSARMRIEDSANWAQMFSGKKTKREYWSLFKKHGTSFGLSSERVVATQTG